MGPRHFLAMSAARVILITFSWCASFGFLPDRARGASEPREAAAAEQPAAAKDQPRTTVVVKLPNFLAGRYWIYVDGEIVRAGNRKSGEFTPLRLEGASVFTDAQGVAARVVDGRGMTFVRAEGREALFESLSVELKLAAGRHVVDLAMPSDGLVPKEQSKFAFTLVSQGVDTEPGKTVAVELCPLTVNLEAPAAAARIVNAEQFPSEAARLKGALALLKSSPIRLALLEADSAPQTRSRMILDLPAELGGRRQFDVQQVRLLIDWLKHREIGELPLMVVLPGQPPEIARDYDDLKRRIQEARAGLDQFQSLVRRMERAAEEEFKELTKTTDDPPRRELKIPKRLAELLKLE